ncbi:MAG TPA: tRNA (adenosine(37)-N6)-dimethylallyltransferase MiaA [Candidatus Aquilonibacter sp.]|nr:tRNA (adenosine(37)-N6)-dimethylallyltransferase MiaA [Candidatus Aquilonibacter sp.]
MGSSVCAGVVARVVNVAQPMVVLVGPTASGKTALALRLAEEFHGEIVSCDAVAVYRGMDIGSAKPSPAERAQVRHHAIDILDPDEPSTAGDYAQVARAALADISGRGGLPVVSGGTGLYLRALLEGLAPAPPRDEALRERLRKRVAERGPEYLHRLLRHMDAKAASSIHANDVPKMIRSLEVTLAARVPQSEQWRAGRDALKGYRVLKLGLNPPRAELYARINDRAAKMFADGLIEETSELRRRFGDECRVLGSLGYAQALAMLRGDMTMDEAIAAAQRGHRNYAKRQMTWFRRDQEIDWIASFGNDVEAQDRALKAVRQHLSA